MINVQSLYGKTVSEKGHYVSSFPHLYAVFEFSIFNLPAVSLASDRLDIRWITFYDTKTILTSVYWLEGFEQALTRATYFVFRSRPRQVSSARCPQTRTCVVKRTAGCSVYCLSNKTMKPTDIIYRRRISRYRLLALTRNAAAILERSSSVWAHSINHTSLNTRLIFTCLFS